MTLRNFRKISLLVCFFYLPFSSLAWGVLGHRIIGQIADNYLSLKAKKAITEILGTESIAMAANWADFIKSDSTLGYISPWHYVNIKEDLGVAEVNNFLESDTSIDAYTKINFLVKQLKNKKLSLANKAFYLKLLIHIAGDIHQPMHTGRLQDQGGNKIKLSWFGTPTNLHRVWDEQLINFQQLSYTEYTTAINHATKSQVKAWQKENLKAWIFDSYKAAGKIYADIQPDEKLDYQYNFKFIGLVNNQLLKGGIHLAGLLNEIFA
jgi:hypothetical protein